MLDIKLDRVMADVTDLLNTLADEEFTSTRIAWRLYREGIRGERVEPSSCPLHAYIRAHVTTAARIAVYSRSVRVWNPDFPQSFYERELPFSVMEFVDRHDEEEFPRLLPASS